MYQSHHSNGVRFTCASCRHDHGLEEIRRAMYLGQRSIGDYQAARRGPGVLGRRLLRRSVTRRLMRALWR
jgi:hypothetical protein